MRKKNVWILLALLLAACHPATKHRQPTAAFFEAAAQPSKTERHAVAEALQRKSVEIPTHLTHRPEQILWRRGYTASYNRQSKNPNWVAWHLTKAHTYGSHQRSEQVFTEDTEVNPRATDNDYYTSDYDRGHMCPAGDNKWDKTAMQQSFLFTNICPQAHNLNKYEWNRVEIKCREWARKYGSVDIVCGPIYDSPHPRTIGRGRVWVPDAFFKVIYCSAKQKAIGFLFRNDGRKVSLASAVRTVDEIEQKTGIDFYPALDDAIESRIEADARLNVW
jgi:endonuclease G